MVGLVFLEGGGQQADLFGRVLVLASPNAIDQVPDFVVHLAGPSI
jgi:hypothetical protein